MRIIIVENADGSNKKTLQFDNPEDFNKFAQDLGKMERDLGMWPGRPLEVPLFSLDVSISKYTATNSSTVNYPAGSGNPV